MVVDWGLLLGAVSAAAIPVGFGIGVVAMAAPSPGEFRFARFCFIVAALAAIGSFAWLSHEMPLNATKLIAAGLVGAIVTIGLVVSLDWVNEKQFPKTPTKTELTTPPLEVYLSDILWIRATQIPFTNFADMQDAIKRHAPTIKPRVIRMGSDTSPYKLNVIIRNDSEVELNEAGIIIDSNLPFTPITLGAGIFSPTQVRYDRPKIEAYQKIGLQHFFTLEFPVETKPSELVVVATIQAKGVRPYLAAGAISFRWDIKSPPAPVPPDPSPPSTPEKK